MQGIGTQFHIFLHTENHWLLRFLKLRAIVNGRDIYFLNARTPLVIFVEQNNPGIVITDGFHFTRPAKVHFKNGNACAFRLSCGVQNWQLMLSIGCTLLLFTAGMWTGHLVFKVLSFFPLVYLLAFYYLNREDFFRLVPLKS